jgi:hypothetical protein
MEIENEELLNQKLKRRAILNSPILKSPIHNCSHFLIDLKVKWPQYQRNAVGIPMGLHVRAVGPPYSREICFQEERQMPMKKKAKKKKH